MSNINAIYIGALPSIGALSSYPTVTNNFGINTAIGTQVYNTPSDGGSTGYVYQLLSGSTTTSVPARIVPNDNSNIYWNLKESTVFLSSTP